MITKAIVEEVISEYSAKVRIPLYDAIEGSRDATLYKDLSNATICSFPNSTNNVSKGDIVFVGFEDNDTGKPIVLGHLVKEKASDTLINLDVGSLTTNSTTKLSSSTYIGNVKPVEIDALKNVKSNIQAQLNVLLENKKEVEEILDKNFPADTEVKKDSQKVITSGGVQKGIIDTYGASIQECTTYDQVATILVTNLNIGYGDIGYNAPTDGLRALLPQVPAVVNKATVSARIISSKNAVNDSYILEFVMRFDWEENNKAPCYKLEVRKSYISGVPTYYVGNWYRPDGWLEGIKTLEEDRAKIDASNLAEADITQWLSKLGLTTAITGTTSGSAGNYLVKTNDFKIITGVAVWSETRSKDLTVAFQEPFVSQPAVVVMPFGKNKTYANCAMGLYLVTADNFSATIYGYGTNDKSVGAHWIAIGK